MASIFDGIEEIAIKTLRQYQVNPRGRSYGTWACHDALVSYISRNQAKGVCLINTLLERSYSTIRQNITNAIASNVSRRSVSRGRMRRKANLSTRRLIASFQQNGDIEVTLERVIVYTQRRKAGSNYEWHNQLNVASGICGSRSGRRAAIDLVRRSTKRDEYLDFIELKEWGSMCTPLYAALEVFRYYCAYLILAKEPLDPHYKDRKDRWPTSQKTRLFVLAPTSWHSRFHDSDFSLLDAFSEALEMLKASHQGFDSCLFYPRPLEMRGLKWRNSKFYSIVPTRRSTAILMSNLTSRSVTQIDRLG